MAFADGMLYGYGENGTVGLITASPDDFRMVSSFQVTKGSGEHWSHPVIANGKLFLRDQDSLYCFDIQK